MRVSQTTATLRVLVRLALVLTLLTSWTSSLLAVSVDYVREIKPLLRERCFACHGALKQKADLRLDTVAAMRRGGRNGPAIQTDLFKQSALLQRARSTDVTDRMPPEHEGEPLNAAQIGLLEDWLAAGAPAPMDETPETDPRDHWAFRSIERPPVPTSTGQASLGARWGRNPIDSFVAREYERHDLTPLPAASREVLIRRLYFDLIGLPPTAEAIATALRDPSELWWGDIVERLLADPRYGERWGRHAMDLWRYSDRWGLGDQLRNSQKHIWHWRDWIVESFNADLPYDEMIRLMLAADELHPNDLSKLRATGYLARNWFLFNRNQWLEETVEHVGKSLLGLTFNCAKCHDHKYDPISQVDFYRVRAFFEPYHVRLDVLPGAPDLEIDGLPRIFDGPTDTPTYRFVRGNENQPDKSVIIAPDVPAALAFAVVKVQPVKLPLEAWQPERRPWVIDDQLAVVRRKELSMQTAEADRARELAAALRKEADLLTSGGRASSGASIVTNPSSTPREAAHLSVEAARSALAVAESALELAQATRADLEARATAMRAAWAKADKGKLADRVPDTALEKAVQEATVAAVQAGRTAVVARARHQLVETTQRRDQAPIERKDSVEKELKSSREILEKALHAAALPIEPTNHYSPIAGARWTPTRFLNSTADDPTVPFPAQSSGRRKALAAWITDRGNPLTARVMVNHVWMRHFGTPLASTVFDFGRKGATPTHPELLDWLAAEFIEHGWSFKHLHRLIVTSATYRLSSALVGDIARTNARRDPDNVYLWRRAPMRLEAEAVRDALLLHAGTLDQTMGGPPIPPAEQAKSKRRSIYFFHSNNDRNDFLTTFDGPAVKECYRRDQSIVPQQALALSNGRLAYDSAVAIAAQLCHPAVSKFASLDDEAFIRRAFLQLLGITVTDAELNVSRHALEQWRKPVVPASRNARANDSVDPMRDDEPRAQLIHTLINHNDFVTIR